MEMPASINESLAEIKRLFPDINISFNVPQKKKNLLLFVHGFIGGTDTFGLFPTLIHNDPTLSSIYNVDHFRYHTDFGLLPAFKRNNKIQTIADTLNSHIESKEYESIDIICHSMGGLITKRYLTKALKSKMEPKVERIIFFAVPHDGAGLANWYKAFNRIQYHVGQMARDCDFLSFIQEDCEYFDINKKYVCKYVAGSQDFVVKEKSALFGAKSYMCSTIEGANHTSVVKPANEIDPIFIITKNFLLGRGPSTALRDIDR